MARVNITSIFEVAYTVTVISVLFCAAAFYFVYALYSLAKGFSSHKGSQVLRISIKSANQIHVTANIDFLTIWLQ